MTRIDPQFQLAQLLRTAAKARPTAAARKAPAQAGGTRGIPAAVSQRIAAIPPTDPDRKRKAVRIFLEHALLRELGAQLAQDAEFPAMVAAVQQQMQEDARFATAVDQLGALLVSA